MKKKDYSTITLKELEQIYEKVGIRHGWDFSRMKASRESVPWEYEKIVLTYVKPTDHVLDIGTGGGEKFLDLSSHFTSGVGIDPYKDMIDEAHKNVKKRKNTNCSFELMGAEDITFPKETFDLVLNRHAVIDAKEIAKVLKKGGYFITQQVANGNMRELKETFSYKKVWKNDNNTLSKIFKKYGFRIVATGEYDVKYFVKDLESLVFWLKAVDMPENFTIKKHGTQLKKYIKEFNTSDGFLTHETRSFFIAQKE